MTVRAARVVPLLVGLPVFLATTIAVAEDAPRSSTIQEEVEVRLVLVDVIVVDGRGRTVPGLTRADFEVTVDGEPIALDTLDALCPGGAMNDAVAVRVADRRGAPPVPEAERNILLAFDYMHLAPTDRARVLEDAQAMVRHSVAPGEQIMVAAITGGLRVELPFTPDRDRVVQTLRRMEYDITLWNGNFSHSTDYGLFHALEALLQVMQRVSGPKAMVLFSNLPGQIVGYDEQYAEIASLAAVSRTAIYPVHAEGLLPPPPG